jgi:hypothetical protein
MAYTAYISSLKDVLKDEKSDNLYTAKVMGDSIIVGGESKDGDVVLYMPEGGAISREFGDKFSLFRKNLDGTPQGGYLEDTGRIRALKLRGLTSEGLAINIENVTKVYPEINGYKEGMVLTELGGKEFVKKYIRKYNPPGQSGGKNKTKHKHANKIVYPFFEEMIDMSQLRYNYHVFQKGDVLTLSEKCHGTSHRAAKTIARTEKHPFLAKLLKRHISYKDTQTFISGTRRTIRTNKSKNPYYSSEVFRDQFDEYVKDKLLPGEEIFVELCGYYSETGLIMPKAENKDKDVKKIYGNEMIFTYGANPGECKWFVYRMTYTTPEGEVIEYPTWQAKQRAEEMGLVFVPVFETFIYTTHEDLIEKVDKYISGPSTIDQRHVREGVCCRIENSRAVKIYKDKNITFKIYAGISVDNNSGLDSAAEEM